MPSQPLAPPSPGPRRHQDVLLLVIIASFSALLLAILAFLLLLCCLYYSLHCARARDPTLPLPLPLDAPFASFLCRFSFRNLHFVIASFDPSPPLPSLGRGASIVVFRGILPNGKSVAIKCLDHPSSSPLSSPPQTSFDREFHNDLHVLAALPPSPFVVSLLGASTAPIATSSSTSICPMVASKMPSSPPPIIISSSARIADSALSSTSPRPSPSSAGIAS